MQPFAYLQLPFATGLGIMLFDETLRLNVALGAAVVVGAGVFTLWRARQAGQSAKLGAGHGRRASRLPLDLIQICAIALCRHLLARDEAQ